MAANSYSQMRKALEEMQARMQREKDEKAQAFGDAVMDLYGDLLLDYGKSDLRLIVKQLDVKKAVDKFERDRSSGQAAKSAETASYSGMAGSDGESG